MPISDELYGSSLRSLKRWSHLSPVFSCLELGGRLLVRHGATLIGLGMHLSFCTFLFDIPHRIRRVQVMASLTNALQQHAASSGFQSRSWALALTSSNVLPTLTHLEEWKTGLRFAGRIFLRVRQIGASLMGVGMLSRLASELGRRAIERQMPSADRPRRFRTKSWRRVNRESIDFLEAARWERLPKSLAEKGLFLSQLPSSDEVALEYGLMRRLAYTHDRGSP